MKICGPKYALCGLVLSVWGIFQLLQTDRQVDRFCSVSVDNLLLDDARQVLLAEHELNAVNVDLLQYYDQLLMGVFFYVRSVALVEDLPEANFTTMGEFYKVVDRGYTQNAYNCWIAACIYVLTFLFSGHQFYLNSRSSLSV